MNELSIIIINALISGVAIFILQKRISDNSERKLQEYKGYIDAQLMSYKNIYDRQIEEQKSQLSFLNSKMILMHTERLSVIIRLNTVLHNLDTAVKDLLKNIDVDDKSQRKQIRYERANSTRLIFHEFSQFIKYNSIYFETSVAAKLFKLEATFNTASDKKYYIDNLIESGHEDLLPDDKLYAIVEEGNKIFSFAIPELIKDIENEFRYLLGVEIKKIDN